MARSISLITFLLSLVLAQTPGKSPEKHPKLLTWKCTLKNGCKSQTSALVLDALAHPVHQLKANALDCGSWGGAPNVTVCPDEATCAKNCVVEGISDYEQYGVVTNGESLSMHQLNKAGKNVSPRVYLLAENDKQYEMLKLTGNEFSFDVDTSKMPCGMNGALYLSEMNEDGGQNQLNRAGASYGTGYCDAQCFTTPFINGVGNIKGKGSCCNEMDIWEANAAANSIAPHTCSQNGLYQCSGTECDFDGVCDKWGCSYNPYALGNRQFYGEGTDFKIDTTRPFTVVTQFPAENGKLQQIRRLYVQDGRIVQNAAVNIPDTQAWDSLNNDYCSRPGGGHFMDLGGMTGMGSALGRGMVLVFSIWWDESGFMNWLDGGNSGPCNATEGDPKVIVKVQPDPNVVFSAIKWGEIGSTFTGKGKRFV